MGSRIRGVKYYKERKRWKAFIKRDKKMVTLGWYEKLEDAITAFDKAILDRDGENARTNASVFKGAPFPVEALRGYSQYQVDQWAMAFEKLREENSMLKKLVTDLQQQNVGLQQKVKELEGGGGMYRKEVGGSASLAIVEQSRHDDGAREEAEQALREMPRASCTTTLYTPTTRRLADVRGGTQT